MQRINIHGTSLEGNLEKDAADRDVIVFLPPSYMREKRRRCPVVYALHGFSIGASRSGQPTRAPGYPYQRRGGSLP